MDIFYCEKIKSDLDFLTQSELGKRFPFTYNDPFFINLTADNPKLTKKCNSKFKISQPLLKRIRFALSYIGLPNFKEIPYTTYFLRPAKDVFSLDFDYLFPPNEKELDIKILLKSFHQYADDLLEKLIQLDCANIVNHLLEKSNHQNKLQIWSLIAEEFIIESSSRVMKTICNDAINQELNSILEFEGTE